jgi:hypothetical protein
MPKPHKGESLSEFMGEFMSDPHDRKKWKNPKQRAAGAYSEMRESKKKRKKHED